jgi:hypothetical protein
MGPSSERPQRFHTSTTTVSTTNTRTSFFYRTKLKVLFSWNNLGRRKEENRPYRCVWYIIPIIYRKTFYFIIRPSCRFLESRRVSVLHAPSYFHFFSCINASTCFSEVRTSGALWIFSFMQIAKKSLQNPDGLTFMTKLFNSMA